MFLERSPTSALICKVSLPYTSTTDTCWFMNGVSTDMNEPFTAVITFS